MPFEHVLPREIILHINWLTVGACRETENRYSKFVPERREYREYDYSSGLCVCVWARWKNFHISRHANVVVLSYVQISDLTISFVRRIPSEIIVVCARMHFYINVLTCGIKIRMYYYYNMRQTTRLRHMPVIVSIHFMNAYMALNRNAKTFFISILFHTLK